MIRKKDIQPTLEKQHDNDKRDLERCVSTTVTFFLVDSYSKNELVQVYNNVKEVWSDVSADPVPKVGGNKNKEEYAKTICFARNFFIEKDQGWPLRAKQQLQEEMTRRDTDQISSIQERMTDIKRHLFFKLLPATHALRSTEAYTEKIDVSAPVNSEFIMIHYNVIALLFFTKIWHLIIDIDSSLIITHIGRATILDTG